MLNCLFTTGEAGLSEESGVGARRTVFLSVHGGGGQVGSVANKPSPSLGVFVGFIMPVTNTGNLMIDKHGDVCGS